jgi:undecaprenyl-diphosphatase
LPGRVLSASVAILAALLFFWLAYTVSVDPLPALDTRIRDAVHSISTPALTLIFYSFTQIGGAFFLVPFGIFIFIPMIRANRRRGALFAIEVLGANLLNELMKLYFHRARPHPFDGFATPVGFSFPSGHSLVSMCFYLALARVSVNPQWPLSRRVPAWVVAAILPLIIGFSRIYIGVHYPTDVLAGWSAGLFWMAFVRTGVLTRRARIARRLPTAPGCV